MIKRAPLSGSKVAAIKAELISAAASKTMTTHQLETKLVSILERK